MTPEDAPLAVFGDAVSAELTSLLDRRGVTVIRSSHAAMREAGGITLHPSGQKIVADQVIALPELRGPALPGIRRTATHGFVSTDRHGKVEGLERVFAAGDLTEFPVKTGASPHSKRMQRPIRSPRSPARTSLRNRSCRCCGAHSGPATVRSISRLA